MKSFVTSHASIFATILFALYSHLVVKWRMNSIAEMPSEFVPKVFFLIGLLINPWMVSAALATFCGGLTWMYAMTQFDLGYAYLYISLLFLLTIVSSIIIFHEPLNLSKSIGGILILVGVIFLGYGQQA